jgi:hypothetical protein
MHNRFVKSAFLGVVLAFPVLATLAAGVSPRGADSVWPLAGAQGLVVLCLVYAARERKKLLEGQTVEVPRTLPARPHAAPHPADAPSRSMV